MSIKHGSGSLPSGNNVLKGTVDASLSANLPLNPSTGDRWRISVAGTFEGSALISPLNYSFTPDDAIEWNGTAWMARESGSDVWITGGTITGITDLAVADGGTGASDAPTARTNLDVYSATETDNAIDTDISTHAALTQTHGISAFGSTLVDDADAATARTTLGVPSSLEMSLSVHEGQEQWYNITVAQNQTLEFPPFTAYSFFEHIKLQDSNPFDVMIRKSGDGTLASHYGFSALNSNSQTEIQNLVADALTDYSSPNQSGDSVTGTTDIVDGRVIKSQFNNVSGFYEVHIYLQDNSGQRVALTGTFDIATTAQSPTVEMRYSDLATVGGSEEFLDDAPSGSTLTVDFTPDPTSSSIKYAIALG